MVVKVVKKAASTATSAVSKAANTTVSAVESTGRAIDKHVTQPVLKTAESAVTTVYNTQKQITEAVYNGQKAVVDLVYEGQKEVVNFVVGETVNVVTFVYKNGVAVVESAYSFQKKAINSVLDAPSNLKSYMEKQVIKLASATETYVQKQIETTKELINCVIDTYEVDGTGMFLQINSVEGGSSLRHQCVKVFKKDTIQNTKEFASDVVKVFVDVAKDIWGPVWNIVNSILEPIANALGFKDKTHKSVDISVTPLFYEDVDFSFKDEVVMKALFQERDINDTFREALDYMSTKDLPKIFLNISSKYYYGFPEVAIDASRIFDRQALLFKAWNDIATRRGITHSFTVDSTLPIELITYSTGIPDVEVLARALLYRGITSHSYFDTVTDKIHLTSVISQAALGVSTTTLDVDFENAYIDVVTNELVIPNYYWDSFKDPREDLHINNPNVFQPIIDNNTGEHKKDFLYQEVIVDPVTQDEYTITYYTYYYLTKRYSSIQRLKLPPLQNRIALIAFRITDPAYQKLNSGTVHFYYEDLGLIDNATFNGTEELEIDALDIRPFTVLPICLGGEFLDSRSPSIWNSVKEMGSDFGMDMQTFSDSLKEEKSANQFDNAVIKFGINVGTTHNASKKYLYTFFNLLYHASSINAEEYIAYTGTKPIQTMIFNEDEYNSAITWAYITKDENGIFNHNKAHDTVEISFSNGNDITIIKYMIENGIKKRSVIFVKNFAGTSLVSISNSPYVEFASMDIKNNTLIVPLMAGLLYELPLFDREAVFKRSAHLVITSGTFYVQRYYQSEKFMQAVAVIATIAIIVSTYGKATAQGASIYAATKVVLLKLVMTYGITYAAIYALEKILERHPNNKLVQAVAIVATIAALTYAGTYGTSPTTITTLLTAVNATTTAGGMYLQQQYKELSNDYEELKRLKAEREKEYNNFMLEFDNNSYAQYFIPMKLESVDMFFNRTVSLDTTSEALNTDIFLISDVDHLLYSI